MRKQYCCDASRLAYEDYYLNQSGNGMPVFQGARMQRGHGLGSVLSGFFRNAWPLIQTGAKAFGRQFLRTGLQIANDVADGEKFKDASMKRIPEGIKAFASSNNFTTQSGGGRKRRRKRAVKRLRKRSKYDIFSNNSDHDNKEEDSASD
jgi:hypothetical protein